MGAGVTEITVPPLSPSSRQLAVIRSYSKDVLGTLWGRGGLQAAFGIELLEKQIVSDPLVWAIQSSQCELVESVEIALM